MFPLEVPSDIHQLHRIKCAPSRPWGAGSVSTVAFESVFDRNKACGGGLSPRGSQVVAHVREQNNVDILEQSISNKVRLTRDQLLGDTRPDFDCAWKFRAFHLTLHCNRGSDV